MPTTLMRIGLCGCGLIFLVVTSIARAQEPAPPAPATPTPEAVAQAFVNQGIQRAAAGDLVQGLAAFEQAIKVDPKCAPAYECRGRIFMSQRDFGKATDDFQKALDINPNFQDALYYRGVVKAMNGDFDGAIADFDGTIKINPSYQPAFYNRGHARYFKGDLDGTIADTTQAIQLNASDNFSHFIRGLARRAKGDEEGAVADFQASANSGYSYAAFWLWVTQIENSNRGQAAQDLQIFLPKSQSPQPDPFALALGNFLLGKTSQDDLLAQAAKGDPSDDQQSGAWYFIGIVKRMAGDTKSAQDAFQQAVASNQKDAEAWVEAGRELAKLNTP